MICKNCGAEIKDYTKFCTKCGARAENENVYSESERTDIRIAQPTAGNGAFNSGGADYHNANSFMNTNQAVYSQPFVQFVRKVEPYTPVSITKFLCWFLVPFIPLIGWIVVIVLACDGSNKDRAHFFRAHILRIVLPVAIVLLIAIIGMGILLIITTVAVRR